MIKNYYLDYENCYSLASESQVIFFQKLDEKIKAVSSPYMLIEILEILLSFSPCTSRVPS